MSASQSTPSVPVAPHYRSLISDAEQRSQQEPPTALQIAHKELDEAEADLATFRRSRPRGKNWLSRHDAVNGRVIAARKAYAAAMWVEYGLGDA